MNATADITQGIPGGIGAPTEHSVRCRSALDTIAVVAALSATIWILDANVSKDVAHAATAAVFAVISAALAFEVLTIGTRGSLTAVWRVAVAVALGSIPIVFIVFDLPYQVAVNQASYPDWEPQPLDRIAIMVAIVAPLVAVATWVPVAMLAALGRRGVVGDFILSMLFALYGATALGTVPVALRMIETREWVDGPPFFAILLALIVAVFVADGCAYVAGRRWGIRPIAARISPDRTWGGLVFGILGPGLVMLVPALPLLIIEAVGGLENPDPPPFWTTLLRVSASYVAIYGLSIVIMGTLGSLFASWFKHIVGANIAGRPFANQMGVLDRMDSLIPVLALFSGFTLSIFLI